jgi:DNA-directed RNA polymerase subunit K/omega
MDDDDYMPEVTDIEADEYEDLDDEEQNDNIDDTIDLDDKLAIDETEKPEEIYDEILDDAEQEQIPEINEEEQVMIRLGKINEKKMKEKLNIDNTHKTIFIVPDDERITSNIIQLYEIAAVISERASQIENGSPIFIDIKNLTNPKDIARAEFKQRKSPFILERHVGNSVEHWKVREMTFPTEWN